MSLVILLGCGELLGKQPLIRIIDVAAIRISCAELFLVIELCHRHWIKQEPDGKQREDNDGNCLLRQCLRCVPVLPFDRGTRSTQYHIKISSLAGLGISVVVV